MVWKAASCALLSALCQWDGGASKDHGVLVGRGVGGGFRAKNVLIENLQSLSLSGERGRSTVSHSNKERRKLLCVI